MILYNVTIQVEEAIEEDWVKWMAEKHIPDVLQSGLFEDHRFMKILSYAEKDHISYCVQYFLPSMEAFERYQKDFAPALQQEYQELFGSRAHAFRTLMEDVDN